jgi:hypothetical protein
VIKSHDFENQSRHLIGAKNKEMVQEVGVLKKTILEQSDAHVKLVGVLKEEKEVLI